MAATDQCFLLRVANDEKLARYRPDASPAWDSLAAADGRLYIALENAQVVCLQGDERERP